MKKYLKVLSLSICILIIIFTNGGKMAIAKSINNNVYTVSPGSSTYGGQYVKSRYYNSYTKDYFLLRSYLEQIEKDGGGTLVLNKGTYTITNTLYVASNTTIILNKGAVIKKGTKTGVKDLNTALSIFMLASQSNSKSVGHYKKYNGESNIEFKGKGNATIDLDYMQGSLGIVIGHNTNVKISGITFKNMNGGHFIELDASKNVEISKNKFLDYKTPSNTNVGPKEAINLDTPDKTTGGFNVVWSSMDKTPNKDVLIKNNVFKNLPIAIGTHKYSENKYHKNVKIINNTITKMSEFGIGMMNWSGSLIQDNIIDGKDMGRGIVGRGVINPTINNNTFKNMYVSMFFQNWNNNNSGSQYNTTYNKISTKNKESLQDNILNNVGSKFVAIYDKDGYNTIEILNIIIKKIPLESLNVNKDNSLLKDTNGIFVCKIISDSEGIFESYDYIDEFYLASPYNTTSKIDYTVSDETILTVGEDGNIKYLKEGTADVTITSGKHSVTIRFILEPFTS